MNTQQFSSLLIFIGFLFLLAGLLWYLAGKYFPSFSLGNLPGDLTYEGKNIKFYFPLATSIFLSVVLTLVFLLFTFLRR